MLKFLTVSSVSSDSIVKGITDDIINTAVKTAEVDSKKQNIYNIYNNRVKLNRDIHFTCILRLMNNTCVKHNFKSVHVSNLFWSGEYNSAKEICKYLSFSKVGGNYPLDLKIIWSSACSETCLKWTCLGLTFVFRKDSSGYFNKKKIAPFIYKLVGSHLIWSVTCGWSVVFSTNITEILLVYNRPSYDIQKM